jgi:hypothetical protein
MLRELLRFFCGPEKFCKDSFINNSHIVLDRCYCGFLFTVNNIAVTDQIRKIILVHVKNNIILSACNIEQITSQQLEKGGHILPE